MADLTVTAASVVLTDGEVGRANAGETITAGQSIYLHATTGAAHKAQCDGTATEASAVGIALNGGGVGQPISYAKTGATMNIGATTSKATVYCVAATAGGIAPLADLTTGNRIVRLGYATATDGSLVVEIKNHNSVV